MNERAYLEMKFQMLKMYEKIKLYLMAMRIRYIKKMSTVQLHLFQIDFVQSSIVFNTSEYFRIRIEPMSVRAMVTLNQPLRELVEMDWMKTGWTKTGWTKMKRIGLCRHALCQDPINHYV